MDHCRGLKPGRFLKSNGRHLTSYVAAPLLADFADRIERLLVNGLALKFDDLDCHLDVIDGLVDGRWLERRVAITTLEELFDSGFATEPAGGAEGKLYVVIVFALFQAENFPYQANCGVAGAVKVKIFPGVANGQDPGLVQGNVSQGLTCGGEVELFFFRFALVFGHITH